MTTKGRVGLDLIGVCVCALCVYRVASGKTRLVMIRRGAKCRDEHGRWDIVAGAVEVHESVRDALEREVREEIGARVLAARILGYRDVHREYDGKPDHWLALDFVVKVDAYEVKIGEPHKFDAIGRFLRDELPSPTHSQFQTILAKYPEAWDFCA